MAHRIKLTVAYLGEGYSGWQRQSRQRTVQGELERALAAMTGASPSVVGAGRTDAGVHAAGQVAHTDLPATIPAGDLVRAMNAALDDHVRVLAARPVPDHFHARRDALGKLYTYRIRWRPSRLPWVGLRSVAVRMPIDQELLRRAMALLPGRRDMASFSVPQQRPTVRTLHRAWVDDQSDGVNLHFVGDGFLRYQVRRMVGAVLDVGSGRLPPAGLEELLVSPRPGARVHTAPARGLTLERVFYRHSPLLQGPCGTETACVAPRTSR